MKTIMVTVICLTYNHVKFIKQALDSFIMQKTNFLFEVLVHDDASTDGTSTIIKEYASRYPDIIKPIFQLENQYSKGISIEKKFIWPKIKGKYVALCEGDDYWTDNRKLQKQFDFMEAYNSYSLCFHPVKIIWENSLQKDKIFPAKKYRCRMAHLTMDSLLKRNFIQTNSVMYRWIFHNTDFDIYPNNIIPGDWFLHLLHAQKGNIYCLNSVMSVYRKHANGVWNMDSENKFYLNNGICYLNFYKQIENYFSVDRTKEKYEILKKMILCFVDNRCYYKIDEIRNLYPLEFKEVIKNIKKLDINKNYKIKYRKIKHILIILLAILVALVFIFLMLLK